MDVRKLKAALDEAQLGLAEVEGQYEALRVRKESLQAIVSSIEAVLQTEQLVALPEPVSAETFQSSGRDAAFAPIPLWKVARDVLVEVKRPMTVPEIVDRLVLRGARNIQGDGIRVAMLRRSDIFDKVGYGRYGLRDWRPFKLYRPENLEELPAEQEATLLAQ